MKFFVAVAAIVLCVSIEAATGLAFLERTQWTNRLTSTQWPTLPPPTATSSSQGFDNGKPRGRQEEVILSQAPSQASHIKANKFASLAVGLFLAVGAVLGPCCPSALAASGDVLRGAELFDLNCAGCHMGGQNFVKPQKTLQQDALMQYLGGTDQSTIESFVKTTSRQHQNLVFYKMPGGKLTDQDYADVTSFVSDQARGDKWVVPNN